MANPYTQSNIGIRRTYSTLGERNYEPKGGCLYASRRHDLYYAGTIYQVGTTIPFDQNSNTTYDDRTMALYWDAGWLTPLS